MVSLEQQVAEREKDRDEKIQLHAQRYRITFPHVIRDRFFGPHLVSDRAEALVQARTTLNALVEANKLVKRDGKSTVAKECYFPKSKTLKESTLPYDLATLWFCQTSPQRRHRVFWNDFKHIFVEPEKSPYKNNQFALVDECGGPVLLRVYHCASEMQDLKKQIERYIKEARKKSRSWVEDGTLGLALLPAVDAKRDAITKFLTTKNKGLGDKPINLMRCVVETAPNESTFPKMLKGL